MPLSWYLSGLCHGSITNLELSMRLLGPIPPWAASHGFRHRFGVVTVLLLLGLLAPTQIPAPIPTPVAKVGVSLEPGAGAGVALPRLRNHGFRVIFISGVYGRKTPVGHRCWGAGVLKLLLQSQGFGAQHLSWCNRAEA